jgi:lipopolysaccharide transport system permease protein
MFATPVLYPAPDAYPASLTMRYNPVSPVLDTARAWLLTGEPTHLSGAGAVTAVTLLVLLGSWVLYRLTLPILIERIGS